MKPLKRKLASSLAMLVFLSAAQLASAFYDPSLGRWLNRDPIGEQGFAAVSQVRRPPVTEKSGLYAFVENDPLGRIDPLGLAGIGALNYGNWCGPLTHGPAPPINALDAACQSHDNILATPKEFFNPIRQLCCNIKFCAEVWAAPCFADHDCLQAKNQILAVCELVLPFFPGPTPF